MGRKFVRVSLGGVHDEAEIRGHRRTYVGALPGNIIQGIRRAGARNAVMMLDEIDKLGRGIQGDPSAAMLEVLDPEQNATFRDNYLAVPFDLSRVVFITTANVLDTIPGPLRDRMEIISLSGYTDGEKLEIAKRYLIRRQLEANGLKPEQAEISDAALREIIDHYTRESGVRNLEREIGRALRNAAVEIAEGKAESVKIGEKDLPAVLGPPRFENEVAMRVSVPGVATGLAWTPVGGDILFVEATRIPGSGRLILTGQLGDVMKESAQAALSLVKSRLDSLGIDPGAGREERHPHPRAGGRDPQGRAERRRGDDHGHRLAPHQPDDPERHGDDRRDQPPRAGAADRRDQGEERRGGPRRADPRHAARPQHEGPRGDLAGRAAAARVHPAREDRRRDRGGAGAGGRGRGQDGGGVEPQPCAARARIRAPGRCSQVLPRNELLEDEAALAAGLDLAPVVAGDHLDRETLGEDRDDGRGIVGLGAQVDEAVDRRAARADGRRCFVGRGAGGDLRARFGRRLALRLLLEQLLTDRIVARDRRAIGERPGLARRRNRARGRPRSPRRAAAG